MQMIKLLKKSLLQSVAAAALAVGSAAHGQVSVLTQPGTVVGSLTGQAWIGTSPTDLYAVPTGRTARVTDVIVWGGDISPGRTCAVMLYCSTSTINTLYFMAEAGKSNHYAMNNGIACPAGGTIQALFYAPVAYSASTSTCGAGGSGNNTPWVTVRGYLFTVP